MADGAAVFRQDFSGPALLVSLNIPFQIRDCHPLWLHFPEYSPKIYQALRLVPFRSPLLRESLRSLFLRVLRCFSSPGLRLRLSFRQPGCPIRTSADQRLFAPPRSFSQLITSFVASRSLGIHRTPFCSSLSPFSSIALPYSVARITPNYLGAFFF